jgi:hypothetical protein
MEPSRKEIEQRVKEFTSAVQAYEQELQDIDKRYDIMVRLAQLPDTHE